MSQTLTINPSSIVLLDKADEFAAQAAAKYLPLKINGPDDAEGYKAVHDARMVMKNARVAVEKKRKELKEDSLAYGRKVDAEAKRINALLEPVELRLSQLQTSIDAERERIKREAEARKNAVIQARVDAMAKVGDQIPFAVAAGLSDVEFGKMLAEQTAVFEAEQARLAKVAAEKAEAERIAAEARKAEADRLATERAKLDAERAELEAARRKQAEEQAAIDAERKRLADAEAARVQGEQQKAREAETAARIARETEERVKREAAEKAAEVARLAAEAEAARKREEALRPDREKILAFAAQIEAIALPELSEDSVEAQIAIEAKVVALCKQIRKLATG